MLRKLTFLFIAAVLLIMTVGCAGLTTGEPDGGIRLTGMVTSIGGRGENFDIQLYSYQFSIQNNNSHLITIIRVEPLLTAGISPKVLNDTLIIEVDRPVPPGEAIEIKGELEFNAIGLTKEEIEGLLPFISSVRVTTDEVLVLPGQN